jgi:hypothetical protein
MANQIFAEPVAPTDNSYSENGYEILEMKIVSNSGGEAIDLSNIWVEIVVNESIWNDELLGEIVLKDGMNLAEVCPIVGNETITLSYRTKGSPDSPITLVGKVYNTVGKARVSNEKAEVYKIQFISNISFANKLATVNGSLRGPISDMISNLFASSFGKESASLLKIGEKTKFIHKFVFPNWSPLFCMRWLTNRAFSSKENPSLFLFYEDVEGFHFKNIMTEISKPAKMEYRVEPKSSVSITSLEGYLSRVQEYSITSYFDRIDEFYDGMFASSLLTHDITSKKFSATSMNYFDVFDSSRNHLNKNPLLPRDTKVSEKMTTSSAAHMSVLPVQSNPFKSVSINDVPERWLLERKSILKQFNTMTMAITVPGNSSMRLLDTVNFSIAKVGYIDESDTEWEDQYLSGKYIVTSIRTMINKIGRYSTTMDIAKESSIRGIPSNFEGKSLFK